MKQLQLDNIRTFVTVVDLGGFAKAGELLGKSQPAVSLQIKKLEEQLGVELFHKQGQRQVVNASGKELYDMALGLLKQNDHILAHFAQTPLTGNLRLGIPSEFASRVLPSIIGNFANTYPEVTLEVTSALSAELLHKHKHSPYDVLLFIGKQQHDPIGQYVISDQLIWAGVGNPSSALDKLKLVLAPPGCRYRERVLEQLNQNQLDWQISFTNTDLTGITAAIKAGLGITVLAKSTVPTELSALKHASLPELGDIDINIVVGETRHPAASQKLANYIYQKLQLGIGS